jgi:hypothetical protein
LTPEVRDEERDTRHEPRGSRFGRIDSSDPGNGPRGFILGARWELEHARANARAGGPVSERDAELLERYGCLSGTNSAFCKQLSKRGKIKYRDARKRTRD